MTERDVARIEKALNVELPTHFRRFIIEHGSTVAKAKRSGGFVPFTWKASELWVNVPSAFRPIVSVVL